MKEKIREYINLCYKIYQKEKMPQAELLILKQVLQKIPVEDKDIIQFVKIYSINEAYQQALEIVRNRKQMQKIVGTPNKERTLKEIEKVLVQACKIQQATEIIKKGNTQTEVICEVTGLSKDKVNILKMQLLGQKKRLLLDISMRDKIIDLLAKGKEMTVAKIQQDLGMTDLEIEDMEEQAKYRRIPEEKRDEQAQIKQDSTIRIVVLCTKLGRNPKQIAKLLKKETEEIEEDKEKALQVGIIQESELQGIQLLNTQILEGTQLGG